MLSPRLPSAKRKFCSSLFCNFSSALAFHTRSFKFGKFQIFRKFQNSYFELRTNQAQLKGCDQVFKKIKCAQNSRVLDFKILENLQFFGKFQDSFFELRTNRAQKKGCCKAYHEIKCAQKSRFLDSKILENFKFLENFKIHFLSYELTEHRKKGLTRLIMK